MIKKGPEHGKQDLFPIFMSLMGGGILLGNGRIGPNKFNIIHALERPPYTLSQLGMSWNLASCRNHASSVTSERKGNEAKVDLNAFGTGLVMRFVFNGYRKRALTKWKIKLFGWSLVHPGLTRWRCDISTAGWFCSIKPLLCGHRATTGGEWGGGE